MTCSTGQLAGESVCGEEGLPWLRSCAASKPGEGRGPKVFLGWQEIGDEEALEGLCTVTAEMSHLENQNNRFFFIPYFLKFGSLLVRSCYPRSKVIWPLLAFQKCSVLYRYPLLNDGAHSDDEAGKRFVVK